MCLRVLGGKTAAAVLMLIKQRLLCLCLMTVQHALYSHILLTMLRVEEEEEEYKS